MALILMLILVLAVVILQVRVYDELRRIRIALEPARDGSDDLPEVR